MTPTLIGRLAVPAFLFFFGTAGGPAAPPAHPTGPAAVADTAWRAHFSFLARAGGVWLTSNAAYRTAENGEAEAYGMRYTYNLGRTSLSGCLWGETGGRKVGTYWHFFASWDPLRHTVQFYQSGAGGMVGIGDEAPAADTAATEMVQAFVAPDGSARRVRHLSTRVHADTLRTESFDATPSGWTPNRTYVWIRRPGDATRGC